MSKPPILFTAARDGRPGDMSQSTQAELARRADPAHADTARDEWGSTCADDLVEGERVGRFVVLRDRDGLLHAVAAGSVGALCETEDGVLMLLPGGRLIHVVRPMSLVLAWLDGRRGA